MLKNADAVDTVTEAREDHRVHALFAQALAWRGLPLGVILTLQAGVALVTLNNSAFQDEALYIYAGRQLLDQYLGGAQVVDPFATYMSGHPDVYPLLAGALDAVGGLALARMLSLVAMLTATACVYWIGQHLFSRHVAIFGAAIFAMQGPVLFLTRLATYDAMCLGLLAIAAVLALKLSVARYPWLALALGPTLVLAFFAKYAFLLWTPTVFGIIALEAWKARGWLSAAIRIALALASTAAAAVVAVAILGTSFTHALVASTLQRQTTGVQVTATRPVLLWEVISFAGIALALGLIGALLVPRSQRLLGWLFVATSVLAPIYHLYHDEPISLVKHLAYGVVFAAPLGGLAIQRLIEWQSARAATAPHAPHAPHMALHGMAVLPVFLIIFTIGLRQAQFLFDQWPGSSQMTTLMRSVVRPESGHYLAEDMEVTRYYLQDVSADWQWTGPFWFEYTTQQGQTLYDADAYKQAIHDGYFNAIELSFGATASLDSQLMAELNASPNYQLVGRIFCTDAFGSGYYYIWRLRAPASSAPQ